MTCPNCNAPEHNGTIRHAPDCVEFVEPSTTEFGDEPPTLGPLDDFIERLEVELRIGGGATLDELFNLAVAIRAELREGKQQ